MGESGQQFFAAVPARCAEDRGFNLLARSWRRARPKGSSISRMAGSQTSGAADGGALLHAARQLPWDICFSNSLNPTMARKLARPARRRGGHRPSLHLGPAAARFSITVRHGSRIGFLEHDADVGARRRPPTLPPTAILPALAGKRPAISLSSVLLPQPLGPHDGGRIRARRLRAICRAGRGMRSLRTVTNSFFQPGDLDHGGGPQRRRACRALHVHAVLPDLTCRRRTGRGRVGASKAVRRRAFNLSRGGILVPAACRHDAVFDQLKILPGFMIPRSPRRPRKRVARAPQGRSRNCRNQRVGQSTP